MSYSSPELSKRPEISRPSSVASQEGGTNPTTSSSSPSLNRRHRSSKGGTGGVALASPRNRMVTDSRPLLSDTQEPIDMVSHNVNAHLLPSQELRTPNTSSQQYFDYGSASPTHAGEKSSQNNHEDANTQENVNKDEYMEEIDDYKPYFCWVTIFLNCLAFVVTMAYAKWDFLPLSKNPMLGPSPEILDDLGAKDTAKLQEGEWWRLILPMYMHGGVFHLAINMFVLWRLGCDLERVFGWARVGSIYMLSGISGTLMSALFVPEILGVGASGALYGLIGSLYGDLIHNWKSLGDNKTCYIIQLVVSTVVGLAVGLMPLLDNFAHVGGFVAGFFAGCVFLHNPIRARHVPFYQYFFFYISIVVLIVWFVAASIMLFTEFEVNKLCSWCQYMSCVELPIWSCSPEKLCYIVDPQDGSRIPVTCEPE